MKRIMALIQAILTFVGIALIGLVFYFDLSSPYNYISVLILLTIAIYLSVKVFRMIVRRGYIETATGDNATYELDNLKPIPGSGITELSPEKLIETFDNQILNFPEVSISIWRDAFGKKMKKKPEILTLEYNDETDILSFKDYSQLKIKKPSIIHHSIRYLKIIKAKEILWRIKEDDQYNEYSYLNNGKEIKTRSNTDWKPKSEDLGIGMNALYFQG